MICQHSKGCKSRRLIAQKRQWKHEEDHRTVKSSSHLFYTSSNLILNHQQSAKAIYKSLETNSIALKRVTTKTPTTTDNNRTHFWFCYRVDTYFIWTKGWFPYDRYDCWKKSSPIVAIIWKPLFSARCKMLWSLWSLKCGFRMIATIAERFLQLLQRS